MFPLEHQEHLLANALALLASLERDPTAWRRLQHQHLKRFPKASCPQCQSPLCLQCGATTWHSGMTCGAYLAYLAESAPSEDIRNSMRWQLENSKQCPTCSVVISRDDGCNKMECLHCGDEFCWVCLKPWSQRCGFYRCVTAPNTAGDDAGAGPSAEKVHEAKAEPSQTENGVPNVAIIQQKLAAGISIAQAQTGEPPTLAALVAAARAGRSAPQPHPPPPPAPDSDSRRTSRRTSVHGMAKDWLVSHGHWGHDIAYY